MRETTSTKDAKTTKLQHDYSVVTQNDPTKICKISTKILKAGYSHTGGAGDILHACVRGPIISQPAYICRLPEIK